MRLSLRFLIPLALVLGLVAYAVVPLANRMMVSWFVNDLDLRSKIIAEAVDNYLLEVSPNKSQLVITAKVQNFFKRVMLDERVYALGFCDATGQKLLFKTDKFPQIISCEPVGTETHVTEVLDQPRGPLHIAYHVVRGTGSVLGELVLIHDMSFVQSRSAATRLYIMYFFAALAAIIAIITVLIAQMSLRGWESGLRSLLRGEGLFKPFSPTGAPRELQPIVKDLRDLIRDLETDRRLRDESQITWNARTLKELLHKELAGDEVIVVSNREPYLNYFGEDGTIQTQTPAAGPVTALEPIMRACSGTWIAHGGGAADHETVDARDHLRIPPDHPRYTLRRVWLTPEEEKGYYYGFANEGLWPLCHIAHVRPTFRSDDWEQYVRVNEKFAKVVAQEAKTRDPVILVQDYHFALLPRILRRHLPQATIIMFWHIPWPNPESFGICPWGQEVLDGLLGSNIVGFHTRFHCLNFMETMDRFVECRVDREHSTISYRRKLTAVNHYPISIEFPGRLMRQATPVPEARAQIRNRYALPADCRIGIGVDRFDYTKGIMEKFLAVERLLELSPEWIGRFSFIQIAAPTRTRIEEYTEFSNETSSLAQRINAKFAHTGVPPIILLAEHHEAEDILDHYRAADLCFVNSLHDGMNLVAKEFVAARDDERGALILSQFTGAARDLPEALIVNPYHIDQCAQELHRALTMPESEQRDRLRSMRGVLKEFNVFRWAGRMLIDAARVRQRNRFLARVAATPWYSSFLPK
ncbi:MAG: trehalose-6-phosphate synthase [Candidatus Peribacteraceae bacterium]|jgi:trehalose 6-phosphate synthase|nr:trehalose-6-phosphate synthase [Candidatus Peribacteraceae bacterium]